MLNAKMNVRFPRSIAALTIPATALFLAACGPTTSDDGASSSSSDALKTTALALSVGASTSSDTEGMRFEIERVACAGEDASKVEAFDYEFEGDYEELTFPADLPAFDKKPYQRDSAHRFADHYKVLGAGCYDVKVTPLSSDGQVSAECSAATANDVVVLDGKTTEITLVSQCEGEQRGGIDIAGTLNYPPHIRDVIYNPSKFNATCTAPIVCVTAQDPDNDPIYFEWLTLNGTEAGHQPVQHSATDLGAGIRRECYTFESVDAASLDIRVKAYDMAYDEHGDLVKIETRIGQDSHDMLTFPLYFSEGDQPCMPGSGQHGGSGGGDADDDDSDD